MSETLALNRLEDQRNFLVRFIENDRPQGSVKNRVTIVFDGKSEFTSWTQSSVEIIFSKDESADDKIERIVSEAKNKKNMVIVTNDRDIQYAVRALGAQVKSVQQFLGKKIKIKKASGVPENIQSEITLELKNVWLKKKEE